MQKDIEIDSAEITKIEAEYQKVLQNKQSLSGKQSENEAVLQELNLVEADKDAISVYKLIGPVLAK